MLVLRGGMSGLSLITMVLNLIPKIHFDCLPFAKGSSAKGDAVFVIGQVSLGHRPERRTNPPLGDEAWQLIEKCWDQDPGKRPSMDDVVDTMIST